MTKKKWVKPGITKTPIAALLPAATTIEQLTPQAGGDEEERLFQIEETIKHARTTMHAVAAERRKLGPIATQAQTSGWRLAEALNHVAALRQPPPPGDDLERVARALADLQYHKSSRGFAVGSKPLHWKLFEDEAQAAIAAHRPNARVVE